MLSISNNFKRYLKHHIKSCLSQYTIEKWQQKRQIISLQISTVYGKVIRQFSRPPFPKSQKQVNLHLGCGRFDHPDFINIDGLPFSHVHYIRSIDNLSPFKDGSVNLIYASHCLEHFSHKSIPTVLREWFRVLEEGGTLRLAVPDFDALLEIYRDSGNDVRTIIEILMGGQDYKFNFHFTVFTERNLKEFLLQAGFRDVREWHPGSCELTIFDDYAARQPFICGKNRSVSLNLEAIK